jgi:PIN domain nuclease of toxin-antitoxin system
MNKKILLKNVHQSIRKKKNFLVIEIKLIKFLVSIQMMNMSLKKIVLTKIKKILKSRISVMIIEILRKREKLKNQSQNNQIKKWVRKAQNQKKMVILSI